MSNDILNRLDDIQSDITAFRHETNRRFDKLSRDLLLLQKSMRGLSMRTAALEDGALAEQEQETLAGLTPVPALAR